MSGARLRSGPGAVSDTSGFTAGSAAGLGDLTLAYAAMVDCWLVGGEARPLAPADWKGMAQSTEPSTTELTLVALAGQFDSVVLRPARPAGAVRLAPLPRLAAPTVPEELRPVLRVALGTGPSAEAVIRMVARRGFVTHPADWFPPRSADQVGGYQAERAGLPEFYLPWLAWVQGTQQQETANQTDATTGTEFRGDWRLLKPAERVAEFEQLRRSDPVASREVLREQFKVLPAAGRTTLLKAMASGLSLDDAELLAELKNDRSATVRSHAEHFLARLGLADNSADAQELADFFTVTVKGLVNKRRVVLPALVKTQAAHTRRSELFQQVSLPQLALALGLEANQLIDAWQTRPGKGGPAEADGVNHDFAAQVARTGSDVSAEALASKLIQDPDSASAASALLGRLGPGMTAQVVVANLRAEPDELTRLAQATDQDVIGPAEAERLASTRNLAKALAETTDGGLIGRLTASATMMTAEAAALTLERLAACGAHRGLEQFACLRLNAELGTRTAGRAQTTTSPIRKDHT